jgi:hypothetical protein
MRKSDAEFQQELNEKVAQLTQVHAAVEQISYAIWGAAVTATRAFEHVGMKIDSNTNRVFVSIRLRWWAKPKRFKPLHDAWLKRAEKRCKEQTPQGWKLLVYFEGGSE